MSTAPDDTPMDRDEQAALWCLTLAEGALRRDEQQHFDAWIAEPENARAFEEAARTWNTADAASNMPELIQARGAALEMFRRANQQRWRRRPGRFAWLGAIAAVMIIALVSAWMFRDPVQVYQTGIGERRIAMLGDGSRLSLDADTEVDVRLHSDRRELTLIHGRAKFDVAKDPLRPFTVTAGDKMVVATGTSFSVELLNTQVHVLLYEGHVAVLDRKDGEAPQPVALRAKAIAADQTLTPGRELVVSADAVAPAVVSTSDPVRSLSWESGQLSFDDEPLPVAVERMNRYSSTKLAIGDATTAQVRVNGVFTAGDTDAFVEGVTALNPVRAEREQGQITLVRN